jgi:hypothetical protein
MPPTDARIGPTRALPPALAIAALALLALAIVAVNRRELSYAAD